eukprot:2066094-Pyramimonas_sp.AAC.1
MCPKRVHAVGFFKSLLDKDLKQTLHLWSSDLDAQATQLKYVLHLTGSERPCVELVQSHNRWISVLQMMSSC